MIKLHDQRQLKEEVVHNGRLGMAAESWSRKLRDCLQSYTERRQSTLEEGQATDPQSPPPSDQCYTFPASLHVLKVPLPPKLCYQPETK